MHYITLYAVRRTLQQNAALGRVGSYIRLCAVSHHESGATHIDYFPRIDQFCD
ncbi:hypothetical protein [Cupriavidus basilensis]|jgi:hypothetical protein|uniref:hypothetical protein n=1 Tax=Cupriavidus basilensis TaxID=68895 RepID=UPI0023E85013|nr:hypothetical protein [Cupriavidus basilensis]MDF3888856.1 hypothetical protein [Cupriavidus basilensis]